MTRLKWFFVFFLRYYRKMGLRVGLYALLALLVASLGPLSATWMTRSIPFDLDFEAVIPVLTILATSMLAVSTFSLNVMVAAHRAASETTTPRVHRILLEDTTTQSVLATFIGAFVYSLGSIILYRSGVYAEETAPLVMGVTIILVALVVVSLLRWIDHLKDLGSVDESLRQAKSRASATLMAYARNPGFGAQQLSDHVITPGSVEKLPVPQSGFLQLIDIARLEECLPEGAAIYVLVHPGDHVLEGEVLGEVAGSVSDEVLADLTEAFTFGPHRTYEQDTEFGLNVLAETASRALSPGINDPGTAIQALSILKELIWGYAKERPSSDAQTAKNVFVRWPEDADLLEAAFASIARDGAGMIEVATALRGALNALANSGNDRVRDAALQLGRRALDYSEAAGLRDHEIDRLRHVTIAGSA